MKICIISDTTYRSASPDYEHCLSFYGSEPYHVLLCKELTKRGHETHFFAPHGSEPACTVFHPLVLSHGTFFDFDTLENITLDPFKTEDCLQFDFIIDMSAAARTVEELFWYHAYKNFCCYRNGYNGFHSPRLHPALKNLVVPSKQNQEIFRQNGFPSRVAYYGIPDFYNPGRADAYFSLFEEKYGLIGGEYWLFPHRPTPDKGIDILMQLVQEFPKETFVLAGTTPITEHRAYLNELRRLAAEHEWKNLKFISLPLNPKHHYYKRELMRRAKGILSPLGENYFEGFGLSSAEAIACGTPVLFTDSPVNRELWKDEEDGLLVSGIAGFRMGIKHFNSYNFTPKNHYSVENYGRRYETIAAEIMMGG